jgi:SAM-dependent methyltransferase
MLADVATVEREGKILEIGSGSGYVKLLNPDVITSDVVPGHADMMIDAESLPFEDRSLRGILLTHVFHHIPHADEFLNEAQRVLVPGGVITMIDVAHTPLSRVVFGRFHPEAYNHTVASWHLDPSGPYGGANQAMTWIVFQRDRAHFERQYPGLRLETVHYLPWLGYLLSGGATRRNFIPTSLVPVINGLDTLTGFLNPLCALHWHIRLRKVRD